uniref:RRM domain-containing protein n=1 Tax=Syphacia muris TaxID=451379 RepID=A0A0N5AN67_9BILA
MYQLNSERRNRKIEPKLKRSLPLEDQLPSQAQQLLVVDSLGTTSTYLNQVAKKMMTTASVPQIPALSQPPLNLFATNIASTPSSATTPSSLCSTSVTAVLNPNFPQLLQYVQPAATAFPYAQPALAAATATAAAPTATAVPSTASLLPPPNAANIFEGVPIFLVPQNGFGSNVSLSVLQKVSDVKPSWTGQSSQLSKPDTSMINVIPEHFHVFIGDLAPEVDNATLKNAFAQFGEISEAKVIRDSQTQKSKGYGFVSFPVKENAEKAIESMNGQMIGRRQIRTNWATRKSNTSEDGSVKEQSYDEIFNATQANNTSVYVGNISVACTENDIREAFNPYGTINEIRVFKQQGYGFVRFSNKEEAAKAIMIMNGKELKGQALRCSWGRNPTEHNSVIVFFDGLHYL